MKKNIVLTRDPNYTDGFGSQLQRILGVYSICKEFGFKYLHSPFKIIEYQGLQSVEINQVNDHFTQECNDRLNMPSDVSSDQIDDYRSVYSDNPDIGYLNSVPDDTLVTSRLPFQICDQHPEIYGCAKGVYRVDVVKNKTFTIGIHVRRGELFVFETHRMLPNQYYIDVALKIIGICQSLGIAFLVELYIEVPEKTLVVTPQHVGMGDKITSNVTITPESCSLHEFDQLPNLTKIINGAMLFTFDKMINCDILITSRSSFSACAAYLKDGISVYHPFWHSMMNKDIPFNDPLFDQRVTQFILSKS